ncbi:MAG: hypothetical protein IAF08_03595 [Rhizobacter sp.]|nr:hypothetical protein [Chlorobiales bacterium]
MMAKELIFKANSVFDSITYDEDANHWYFTFSDEIYASSSGFWRLLEANKIVLVSLDNKHQLGLSKPLDLVGEIAKRLRRKKLIEINVDEDTGDLTLIISDDMKIQIYIASSGYETYEFSYQDKRYIGLGSGEIAIVNNQ